MVSAVALIYESRMHKLVAHIIWPTRFSTSKSDIYHGGRCICIISALTHQICQLGKPLGAAVVRKPKQITLRLTPRRHHTLPPRHTTQLTPRRHLTLPPRHTKEAPKHCTTQSHTKEPPHSGTPWHHQGTVPYNLHIELSSRKLTAVFLFSA